MEMTASIVDRTSTPQAKIALFRSLFRGREDVYARRFESRKTGKSGYAPACSNEWVRGVCEKPRIKCAECPNRRFLPVTDDVIRWHLSGYDPQGQPFVAGFYPLLLDETCFFLAVDFDKANWREDAAAFLETCRRLHLEAAIERSRSGRGAHVWFFFEEAIPAALARRLGSHVLTETMESRPDVGLDSYDRLFPNQDTMPQGGFGNLIALPLQMGPRKQDNGVFLDSNFVPWPDQWAFLGSVGRMNRAQIEGIVQDAERQGRVLGVRLPPQDDGEDALDSYEDDEYDEDDYEDDEDSYGYYDEYEDSAPARQPMFYVFVALAALVGGIVVFLLFSLVNNGNGGSPSGGGDTKFAVSTASPP